MTNRNLAWACTFCNRFKGTDLGSIAPQTRQLTRFFNPRDDRWSEHFRLEGARIVPRTAIGEVTARILDFNSMDRVQERSILIGLGRYPSPAARHLVEGSNAR